MLIILYMDSMEVLHNVVNNNSKIIIHTKKYTVHVRVEKREAQFCGFFTVQHKDLYSGVIDPHG